MPKRLERSDCVPEAILGADGNIETVMLDERYKPHEGQSTRVENLCGSFLEAVSSHNLRGVLVDTHNQFGKQKEVFNIHGNVSLSKGKGSFMGARDRAGLEKLASSLGLSQSRCMVHMAVMCAKTGQRVQVKSSGLLESKLMTQFSKYVRVEGRMYDHTNTVRISVREFSGDVFGLEKRFQPDKNDWTITGRGIVMIRFTWKRLEWTHECEAACLALCDRVIHGCLVTRQ